MELLQAVKGRRLIRKYKNKDIPDIVLEDRIKLC